MSGGGTTYSPAFGRLLEMPPGDESCSEVFETEALAQFQQQALHCPPYRDYLALMGIDPRSANRLDQVPFLPIELFKSHRVYDDRAAEPQAVFTSSGTSGPQTSRHYVADRSLYEASFERGFGRFYGDPAAWSIFALLPSYLEREGSSLVYMAERLHARNPREGGFFLHDHQGLKRALNEAARAGKKILLLGVSFALLDFAESLGAPLRLPADAVVMETGGMKGRRGEIGRSELHERLKQAFGVQRIHSEYGMTELLSQAYSDGDGVFRTPSWMKVTLRDPYNPLAESDRGAIAVIDLANRFSCSFVLTQDLGERVGENEFRVLGRLEQAPLRGCNLLLNDE